MKSIGKIKSIICVAMALAILCSLPFAKGVFAASNDGLNGTSGKWSEFDQSVYDVAVSSSEVKSSGFTWPVSGTVLVRASATSSSYTIAKFNGITIPAGLIVDFYKYDANGNTYTLLGHFDTTDGKAYTIGSSTKADDTGSEYHGGGLMFNAGSEAAGDPDDVDDSGNSDTTPSSKPVTYTHSYGDVKPGDWYYDAVMTLTEGGVLAGYPNGNFGPNDVITYGQYQIIMARLKSNPAFLENVMHNYSSSELYNTLHYGEVMTRGRTAALLRNEISYSGKTVLQYVPLSDEELALAKSTYADVIYDLTLSSGRTLKQCMEKPYCEFWKTTLDKGIQYRASLDDFPDGDDIWEFCYNNYESHGAGNTPEEDTQQMVDKIISCWNLGIFAGVDSKGTFNPYGQLTRAQFCTVLYRMGWTTAGSR